MKGRIIILLAGLFVGALVSCNKIDPADDPENPPVVKPEDDPDDSKEPVEDSNLPKIGDFNYLVLLVETSDVHFSIDNPQEAFWNMLNEPGYDDFGGTGSVKDYFEDQSLDLFHPTFDVYGPVVVDMTMSNFIVNYGLTKLGAPRLLAMACDQIDDEVDFSKYDTNDDGYIDNVFFYYAGYNSADGPDEAIWPHADVVEYKSWTFDGVRLHNFACTSELKGSEGVNMSRIGNFCHEFAHILGLPDVYDTTYGKADGLGDFSLMHSGCYNNNGNTPPSLNSEERILLGWMDEIPQVPESGSSLSVGPISSNISYMIETDNPGEHFTIEYRDGKGWDAYVPQGLVIYHVDKSENMVNGRTAAYRWKYLCDLNGDPSHECFDLVKASDECPVFGKGVNEFTPVAWSGEVQKPSLKDIAISSTVVSLNVL